MPSVLRKFLFFSMVLTGTTGWHDLTNINFHCWPFGANDDQPTSFPGCAGIDADWIVPPPHQVRDNEPFDVVFSLTLTNDFYSWAVSDANDGFKTNFFVNLNGSVKYSTANEAKQWCEDSQCPTSCGEANQENCCIHHANVHSCPVSDVSFGLCPPWIPADGEFYTHSQVSCGSASQNNWTAHVTGLTVKNGQTTATALIAHFKIATMHLALNWMIDVKSRIVCGDSECHEGEDCLVCPSDCGRCPLSLGGIIAIALTCVLVLALLLTGLCIIRKKNEQLLLDEGWVVDYSNLKSTNDDQAMVAYAGSQINFIDILESKSRNTGLPVPQRNKGCLELVTHEDGVCVLKRLDRHSVKLTRVLRREVKEMRTLSHINLVPFVGAILKSPNIGILTPHYRKGNLRQVLCVHEIPVSWSFKFSFANDIINALVYLHSRKIVHGNLKLENCLLDDRWTVKLTDFGLPTLRMPESALSSSGRAYLVAPEVVDGIHTPPSDVFSFGVIVVQICTRCALPKDEQMDTMSKVKMEWQNQLIRNELASADEKCPKPREIGLLVEACWNEKPHLRPTVSLVKKHLSLINPSKMNAVDIMMMMMEKYSKHLEQMVKEKTQDLINEKIRTDELLHAMLPKQVADDLRMGRPVLASYYDSCTIYFSDVVGFTNIAGKCTPMEVVVLLNSLYNCFDNVIDKHDVYKVETIGDAYMVVSGVPILNGEMHAIHIANMALDLLDASRSFVIPNMPEEPLRIRVGLHSGPVCAGVVGMKMPRYCLFGDTVNTASRMESSGETYKIHISSTTKDLLSQGAGGKKYIINERGTITVKGKGEMMTYWLDGVRMAGQNMDRSYLAPPTLPGSLPGEIM